MIGEEVVKVGQNKRPSPYDTSTTTYQNGKRMLWVHLRQDNAT